MKEAGYGKEDICTDLFVDIAALALFSDRDYCDLLIYRGESVWVTGRDFLPNFILRYSLPVLIIL